MTDRNKTAGNRKRIPLFVILLLTCTIIAVPAGAMTNPATGYCNALGFQYRDSTGADGSMTGYCILPGNQSVDAWQFLQGNVSPDQGYCKKQGLEVRTVHDSKVCGLLGSTCAVCVKADGSTQEVTAMMGLDFREKICNDKICCDPATDETCAIGQESPNSGTADGLLPVLIIALGVFILAGLYWYFLRKKKNGKGQ